MFKWLSESAIALVRAGKARMHRALGNEQGPHATESYAGLIERLRSQDVLSHEDALRLQTQTRLLFEDPYGTAAHGAVADREDADARRRDMHLMSDLLRESGLPEGMFWVGFHLEMASKNYRAGRVIAAAREQAGSDHEQVREVLDAARSRALNAMEGHKAWAVKVAERMLAKKPMH